MRRALAIAAAAWSASARTRAIWDASNAPCRALNGPERPEDRLAARDRRRHHRADADVGDDAVGAFGVLDRRIGEVVVGQDDAALRDRPTEHPDPDRQGDRADPGAAAPAADAGVVGEAQVPGRRVHEVDHRAVRVEEAGRLGDRRDQQVVDVAAAAVGVVPGDPLGARRCRALRGGPATVAVGALGGRLAGRSRARGLCGHGPRIRCDRRRRHRRSPRPSTSSGRCRDPAAVEAGQGRPSRRKDDERPTPPPRDRSHDAHRAGTRRDPTVIRGQPPDVRFPNPAPRVRRRTPRRHRGPGPVHGLHPLHPRRPALHAERRGLRHRRRRDGHPARARRPLPLVHPPRPRSAMR